ncbi:unnamed protein product [Brachionus calyciflorus]|uniref:Ion transport domain-containing protein n=1 Tax=Brachionus calyciflorus TaxID=104777 RepID=A0A813YYJ8_9BILA|nr:unnamed protein product [Brachionus calyciflorus]
MSEKLKICGKFISKQPYSLFIVYENEEMSYEDFLKKKKESVIKHITIDQCLDIELEAIDLSKFVNVQAFEIKLGDKYLINKNNFNFTDYSKDFSSFTNFLICSGYPILDFKIFQKLSQLKTLKLFFLDQSVNYETRYVVVVNSSEKIIKLDELDFSGCKMSGSSDENLKKLFKKVSSKKIKLNQNLLENFDYSFCEPNHKDLEEIDLSDNKLKSCPLFGENLVKLKSINLSYNKLEQIPFDYYNLVDCEINLEENAELKLDISSLKNSKSRFKLSLENIETLFPEFFNKEELCINKVSTGASNDGEMISLDFIIKTFKNSNVLKIFEALKNYYNQEPKIKNYEYIQLKSKDSMTILIRKACETKDNMIDFEKLFPKNDYLFAIYYYNGGYFENTDSMKIKIKDIEKYVYHPKFFCDIDYKECLEIAFEMENKLMVIYLIVFMKLSLTYYKYSVLREKEFDYENIHKLPLSIVITKLVEKKWFDLLEHVLHFLFNKETLNFTEEEYQKILDKKLSITKEILNLESNIDIVISISKNRYKKLLKHEIIKEILLNNWSGITRFLYYLNLIFYLIFLGIYSYHVEVYQINDENNNNFSKYVSLVFAFIYFFAEIKEFVYAIKSYRILNYLSSFQNIFEMFTYILIIVGLLLINTLEQFELKNALYSITILTSYFIMILNLNKAPLVGRYVIAIRNVIKNSIGLFIVLLIFLIGYLMSLRNRSNSLNENDPTIGFFNETFELGFFRVLTMGVGSLDTEDMGIENINELGFINCLLYATFIFIMPIMLMNIFIGISNEELEKVYDLADVETIILKFEYVLKVKDNIFYKLFSKLKKALKVDHFEFKVERKLNEVKGKFLDFVNKNSYISDTIKNYKIKNNFKYKTAEGNKKKKIVSERTNLFEIIE